MSTAKKIKEHTDIAVRSFVKDLAVEDKKILLDWSERALTIRNNIGLSKADKIKALVALENQESLKIILRKLFDALKAKVWTNQSWARRLGFVGLGAGISFGGAAVGVATMGAGIGVPLMVMTAAGGVVLGAAIDEIKKEL